jgi:hypothetical protein
MTTEGGGASRSTEPARGSSTATDVSLRELEAELRRADEKFHAERERRHSEVATERDRRYSEVNVEKEKALKIKEEADKAALGLAREIQTYKDEKANELREQINSERGLYATKGDVTSAVEKVEAAIKPLSDYVQAQQGLTKGVGLSATTLQNLILLAIAAASLIYAVTK